MFRLTENPNLVFDALAKSLLKIAYRLMICFEDKSKDGSECKPHYHGFIEMDGNKTTKQNNDKLRYVLKQHKERKNDICINEITEQDEKATLSYVTKQKDIRCEYNTSYSPDDLQEWWKEENKRRKELQSERRKQFKDEIVEQYFAEINNKQSLSEIKVWVARKLIDRDLLPVMGKVRAYTMYIVHKCRLEHVLLEELDKLL